MKLNVHNICGHSGCAHSDVRNLNTIIVEGPIERHKSRLASREIGDGLWHIQWGKFEPNRIGAEMVARAPYVRRPEGSLSTGESRALVKP